MVADPVTIGTQGRQTPFLSLLQNKNINVSLRNELYVY